MLLLSALLVPAVAQNPAPVPVLWLTTHQTLQRLNLDLNQVDRNLALPHEARALVLDPADGAVWALVQKQLLKFTADGQPAYQVDLTSRVQKWDDPRWLALNPYDASLWVAGEKVLLHLDAQGQRLQAVASADEIQALGLDGDESLWLLGHQQLRHLSPQGTLLHSLDLKPLIKDPEYLAVDSLGGLLWVAGKKALVQLDLHHLDQTPRTVLLPGNANGADNNTNDDDKKILALTVDPLLGNLWVVTRQNLLFLYDRGANLLKTVDLGSLGLGKVGALAFEPVSASFWLAGERAVVRFSRNGEFTARLAVDKATEALGVAPFRLLPTLSLLSPPDNGLTNNPRPPLRLGLGASCNAIPCILPDAYTQALSLDALLNGLAIGNLFTIAQGEANYTPGQRLPEGLNLFTAQATDLFGHQSDKLNTRFTIDTIPPKFLSVSPVDGSTLITSAALIQGTIDDPTASVVLLDAAGQVVSLASGAHFSFAVTLSPGSNAFTLIARDPAGNETTVVLHLTYVAVTVTLVNPLPNASLSSTSLDVNGTFQGPVNTGITVNGVVAMLFGNQFFANLDLDPGVNTLTITATTPDGATVTKTITVTVTASAPDPVQVAVSPQGGVAPLATQFTVTNNSGLGIQRIEADFDGNGSVDFTATDPHAAIVYTYANPGAYAATISVTDSQGTAHAKTLYVVANDPAQMDTLFKSIWDGMNQGLVRGDINTALHYLNEGAQRKYQPVFQTLLPQMATIIASYSPLERTSIAENIGEYGVIRAFNGNNRLYLIYFLKGADGVWRLDAM
ncbi:hypothetical protein [Sulfuricaulis sp.]